MLPYALGTDSHSAFTASAKAKRKGGNMASGTKTGARSGLNTSANTGQQAAPASQDHGGDRLAQLARCTLVVTTLLQALWSGAAFWYVDTAPNPLAMPFGMAVTCVIAFAASALLARKSSRAGMLAHAPLACALLQLAAAVTLLPAISGSLSGAAWFATAAFHWLGMGLATATCIACTAELDVRGRMGVVACSVVLSVLIRGGLKVVNGDDLLPSFGLSLVLCVLSCLLAGPSVRRLSQKARMATEAPANAQLTQPSSLLPIGHRVSVATFSYGLMAGLAFYFGKSVDPLPMILAALPTPLIVGALMARRCSRPLDILDALVRAVSLIALCALCLFAVATPTTTGILFFAVEGLCYLQLLCLASELVARNPEGGPVVLARTVGLFVLGWGLCAWFVMDFAPNASLDYTAFFAAVVFIVLGEWGQLGPKLDASASAVTAPAEVVAPPHAPDSSVLEEMARSCGLTSREAEIFEKLARGRNAQFLQDELGIKHSTAKSHIAHIYAKLGVHGQQELIDLVEAQTNATRL